MSRKLNFIPEIPDYDYIKNQMEEDLKYRLENRKRKTSLGRPLYERINVQVVMTQECPCNCPFCLERKNPMKGQFDEQAQIKALQSVLKEHPNARLTITGGEPGLYPKHVKNLVDVFKRECNNVFASINTAGYSTELQGLAHINLSINDYVQICESGLLSACCKNLGYCKNCDPVGNNCEVCWNMPGEDE